MSTGVYCKYNTIEEWRLSGQTEIDHRDICPNLALEMEQVGKFVRGKFPDYLIGVTFMGIKIT
jgi:hypothetical protein